MSPVSVRQAPSYSYSPERQVFGKPDIQPSAAPVAGRAWVFFAVAASGIAAISVAGREVVGREAKVEALMADMGYVVPTDLDASIGSIALDADAFEGFPDPGELDDSVSVDNAMAGAIFQDYILYAEDSPEPGERIQLNFGSPAFEDACCDDEDSGCVPTDEPCQIFPDAADRINRMLEA